MKTVTSIQEAQQHFDSNHEPITGDLNGQTRQLNNLGEAQEFFAADLSKGTDTANGSEQSAQATSQSDLSGEAEDEYEDDDDDDQ